MKAVIKIQFTSVYLLMWIVLGIRNKSRPVNQTCFCEDGPGFSKWEPMHKNITSESESQHCHLLEVVICVTPVVPLTSLRCRSRCCFSQQLAGNTRQHNLLLKHQQKCATDISAYFHTSSNWDNEGMTRCAAEADLTATSPTCANSSRAFLHPIPTSVRTSCDR